MGLHDRDYYREHHRAAARAKHRPTWTTDRSRSTPGWLVALIWVLIGAAVFAVFKHFEHRLSPSYSKPRLVSAGELHIPRSRDGHYYADGLVNGRQVKFLIDTGATMVSISHEFGRQLALSGVSSQSRTANGTMPTVDAHGVSVQVGPLRVDNLQVSMGLVGHRADEALLGQNFLSKFEVLMRQNLMVIRAP